ncbi:MAG: Fe-S cluster assembly protein SufD [Pseudobacteriovorax sp.]|nr:Fe-S cluster assembly protein SufD [Pseudobacteriovorax sp.]
MESLKKIYEGNRREFGNIARLKNFSAEKFQEFEALGLPNRFKNDDWKYTNINRAFPEDLSYLGLSDTPDTANAPELDSRYYDIHIANGVITNLNFKLDGVSVGHGLSESWDSIEQSLSRYKIKNGVEALSQAIAGNIVTLKVDPATIVDKPIRLFFYHGHQLEKSLVNSLVLIEVGRNAEVSILEDHIGPVESKDTLNHSFFISIDDNASLNHVKIQNTGSQTSFIDHSKITLNRHSRYKAYNLARGSHFARYELSMLLQGEGSEATFNAAYTTVEGQHLDHHTIVDHAVPNCVSQQLYKGITSDGGRSVFNGKVFIRKNAVGTDASQMNKNLLLGDQAEVDTKPQMEIDADDVKCGHGATVGGIDPDQIFYLLSRGVPKDRAIMMLARGFLRDATLDSLDPLLKERINEELEHGLAAYVQ